MRSLLTLVLFISISGLSIDSWGSPLESCEALLGQIGLDSARESRIVGRPYMTVFRYYGQPDFKGAQVMGLVREDGFFQFDQVGELNAIPRQQDHQPTTPESLLTYNQSFSLSLMEADQYLTAEEVDFQKNVEKTVRPEQITFTEIGELVRPEEHNPLDLPERQRGKLLKTVAGLGPNHPDYVEFKKSGMWMVSGQILETQGRGSSEVFRVNELPWQGDPDFKGDIRLALDRSEYPLVWEFGRAGQIDPRTIQYNLQALTILAYQEKRHLERFLGPQKGYVFVHALDSKRAALFERVYKAKRFPEDWDNPENVILMMDIDELIRMPKFRPSKLSGRLNKIIELSGGTLDDLQALELWTEHLSLYRKDLDIYVGDSLTSSPVVFEDMTLFGYRQKMSALLDQSEIGQDDKRRLIAYMMSNIHFASLDPTLYPFADELQNAWQRLARYNAVFLRNLDPELVNSQGAYLEVLLKSSFGLHLKNKGSQGPFNICIRATDTRIIEKMTALGATVEQLGLGQSKVSLLCMTSAQVQGLDTPSAVQLRVEESYWNTRRLMALPQQF
jgi:hypothetical protein